MSNTIENMAVGKLTLNGSSALPVETGGFTVGATMTVSPETTAESGFLTVTVAGVEYQIPAYAA